MFKDIDRRLATIVLIVFVQIVGASMVLPILPTYARRAFGVSEGVVTLLITSFFIAQFIAGPFLGRLSDVYGRLPLLIISQIGTVIAFAVLGLAESVALLFFARILDGITGGNIIVAQAYVTDITPPKQRTQALGYIFLSFGVGFIFGPSVGGVLGSLFGPRVPFFFAAVVALLTTLITWFALDETLSLEQRSQNRGTRTRLGPRFVLANIALLLVLVIGFGTQFAFSMLQSTFALYGEDVLFPQYDAAAATLRIGLLLSVIGFGQIFTQLFLLRRLLPRLGEHVLVILGTLGRGISFLILASLPMTGAAAVALLLFAISTGIQFPSLQGLVANSVPNEVRGAALGMFQSTANLGIIFGSAVAGVLFGLTPLLPYWLGGGLFLLLLIPAFALRRRRPVEESIVQEAV